MVKKSKGASAETWTYSYDHADRLTFATAAATDGGAATALVTYTYDAFGNRSQREYYDGDGGRLYTDRYGYDGWDTAKPIPVANENFDAWVDLNASNVLTMRRLYDGQSADGPVARQVC